MKKGCINFLVVVLFLISGVFIYLAFSEGFYSVESKIKNNAIRDVVVYENEDPLNRHIDFGKLKAINKDVVAWVYIPGTTVDYPILIGGNNEEYLYKDIEGGYNPLGSIFSYANSSKDFLDGQMFVFGHNMRQYQMFGEIRKFLNEDYMREHRKFYVYTERRTTEYDIFSIFSCNENDDFFTTGIELGTSDYVTLLNSLIERNVNSDYDLGSNTIKWSDSQVVSLVTCNGVEGTTERLTVNGIAFREKYIIN